MVWSLEGNLFEEFFQYRIQSSRADVLGGCVDLRSCFRNGPDGLLAETQFEFLGSEQGTVLADE